MNVNTPADADKLRHANRTLRMISECNQMLARAVDETELLHNLCRIAIENGGYHLSWVGMAETDGAKTVRPVAHAGFKDDYLETVRATWDDTGHGRGPTGTAIRTRKPAIARDIATDPSMAPWRETALNHGYNSSIALPLVVDGQMFGAWMIYSTQPDAFDESEVTLLKELTRDVEFGLHALRMRAENRRAEEALRKSEATLSSVFRAAPAGICIMKNRVFESANDYWCTNFKYSETDILGKSTRILYESDAEWERVGKALYTDLRIKGQTSVETRLRCGDGSVREVIVSAAAIQPQNPSAGTVAIIHDITGLKRNEKALRESETTLRSVLRAAPVGIGIIKDRLIESANKYWCEMVGCPEEDLIGKSTRTLYENDKEYERVGRELYANPQNQGLATIESRIRCGKALRDVVIMVAPVQPDDPAAGVVTIIRDITNYKNAERKLKQYRSRLEEMVASRTTELQAAKEQLEAIFQAANVGIAVLRDRIVMRCNARLEAILGYAAGELVGTSTHPWYTCEADYETVGRDVANTVWSGKVYRSTQRYQRKDGTVFWARLTDRALDVSDPGKGLVAVIEDITAEREAEEALRFAIAEQQAIFGSATSGIVLVKNRVIVQCNHKMDELFGYAPGEMLGQTTHVWYADEATYQAIGQETSACLANGTTFCREQQLVRKDGSLFWGRMTAQAVDKTCPARGLVGMIDDISAERAYEKSLQHALERAEESDRLKSAFLATMSHELRTPLNSIIGFTGILLQELAGPLNAEQSKQLGMVQNSSRHLLALINDVLDISKIEAGQMQVREEPFDLQASIVKVAGIIRPQAEKKGLSLNMQLAPEIGGWMSDARRVEQVLLNLLNNAVKFTEHGAVTLTAEIAEGTLRISVADTGIGIKPEDLSQLFQPFRQIDSGLSRQHEGTGLGLAICRRLAQLLGGEIHAASDWGKGSVFTLILPAKAPGIEHPAGETGKGTPR